VIVAGVDGGQTSTIAVAGDENGRIVGRGVAGPADEVGEGRDSTRMHDAINEALRRALLAGSLPEPTRFDAVVAGVSGYEGRVYGRTPTVPATRFVLMHDAPVAHAGALGGEAGVTVIAGTGSVVYATDGKRGWTTGGWGYLFGDEGSAFWFAREALSLLMHCEDLSNGPDYSRQARAACEFFGLPSLRAVARAFYAGDLTRDRIAAFAVEALEWHEIRKRVSWGANALAQLVGDAFAAGAPQRVALAGGMFSNAGFSSEVRSHIERTCRGVRIVEPMYEPAVGALLLAYREAGIARTEISR